MQSYDEHVGINSPFTIRLSYLTFTVTFGSVEGRGKIYKWTNFVFKDEKAPYLQIMEVFVWPLRCLMTPNMILEQLHSSLFFVLFSIVPILLKSGDLCFLMLGF